MFFILGTVLPRTCTRGVSFSYALTIYPITVRLARGCIVTHRGSSIFPGKSKCKASTGLGMTKAPTRLKPAADQAKSHTGAPVSSKSAGLPLKITRSVASHLKDRAVSTDSDVQILGETRAEILESPEESLKDKDSQRPRLVDKEEEDEDERPLSRKKAKQQADHRVCPRATVVGELAPPARESAHSSSNSITLAVL